MQWEGGAQQEAGHANRQDQERLLLRPCADRATPAPMEARQAGHKTNLRHSQSDASDKTGIKAPSKPAGLAGENQPGLLTPEDALN